MIQKFKHKQTDVIGTNDSDKDNFLHFERCAGNMCSVETLSMDFVTNSNDWISISQGTAMQEAILKIKKDYVINNKLRPDYVFDVLEQALDAETQQLIDVAKYGLITVDDDNNFSVTDTRTFNKSNLEKELRKDQRDVLYKMAEDVWDSMDNEGDVNDRDYWMRGFVVSYNHFKSE